MLRFLSARYCVAAQVVWSGLYDRMAVSYATCSGPSEAAAANCTELVESFGAKFKVSLLQTAPFHQAKSNMERTAVPAAE